MKTLHHIALAAIIAITAAVTADQPARAQEAPKWRPSLDQVIISAKRPDRHYRLVLSNSRIGEAYFISASVKVPYNDLNLRQDPDAEELGRRIHAAARVVCRQMDLKYPPSVYPILEGFDCVGDASRDGMEQANLVIANARH